MKFTANRKKLAETLAFVLPAVATRTPKPILTQVRLRAEGDRLTIDGSDFEVGAEGSMEVRVGQSGVVLLDAVRLSKALSLLPDDEIEIRTDDAKCRIVAARSKVEMQTMDSADWPRFQALDLPGKPDFEIEAKALAAYIASCAYAASDDSARYTFHAINLEYAKGMLHVVATDGHIMVSREAKVGGSGGFTALVPGKLSRFLSAMDGPVTVLRSDNAVLVSAKDRAVAVRQVEGRFPRWRDVFKEAEKSGLVGPVEIPSAALSDACRLASIGADRSAEERGLTVNLSDGEVSVSSQQEMGFGETKIPVSFSGKGSEILLGRGLLSDMLSACGLDAVSVHLNKDYLRIKADGLDAILMGMT